MKKATYVEDNSWRQFALLNTELLDKDIFVKQVEFQLSEKQYEFIVYWNIDEVKKSIKEILTAQFPDD
jgi:hypothetical protein